METAIHGAPDMRNKAIWRLQQPRLQQPTQEAAERIVCMERGDRFALVAKTVKRNEVPEVLFQVTVLHMSSDPDTKRYVFRFPVGYTQTVDVDDEDFATLLQSLKDMYDRRYPFFLGGRDSHGRSGTAWIRCASVQPVVTWVA